VFDVAVILNLVASPVVEPACWLIQNSNAFFSLLVSLRLGSLFALCRAWAEPKLSTGSARAKNRTEPSRARLDSVSSSGRAESRTEMSRAEMSEPNRAERNQAGSTMFQARAEPNWTELSRTEPNRINIALTVSRPHFLCSSS